MKPARGDKQISIRERDQVCSPLCVCSLSLPAWLLYRAAAHCRRRCMRGLGQLHVSKRKKETAEASDIGGVGGDGTPSSCYVSPFTNSPRGPRELQPSIFVFHPPYTLLCSSLCVCAFPPPRACSVLRVPVVAPCERCCQAQLFLEAAREKLGEWGWRGMRLRGRRKAGFAGDPWTRCVPTMCGPQASVALQELASRCDSISRLVLFQSL